MYCKKCFRKIDDADKFCKYCGAEVNTEALEEAIFETAEEKRTRTNKKEDGFATCATVSSIIGIIAIVFSILPIMVGFAFGIVGTILALVSCKSTTERARKDRIIGLVLSLVAMFISIVTCVIMIVLIVKGAIDLAGIDFVFRLVR